MRISNDNAMQDAEAGSKQLAAILELGNDETSRQVIFLYYRDGMQITFV